MDENYKKYLWKKIAVMTNEYTTMCDEDKNEYIAFYVKQLLAGSIRES